MKSLRRCTTLVLAALVVRAAARVPCGAHQNVDGLGAGPNQPNVITQSVTWTPNKKSGKQSSTTVETECPIEDLLIDVPERNMKLVHTRGQFKRDTDYDFDAKLRRLVDILDGMAARESDRKRSSRMKRRRYQYDIPDDSVEDYDDDPPPSYREPVRRRRYRIPRYPKAYDEDEVEEPEPPRKRFPMVPKMDWLVLKKNPKRYQKRWKEDEDRGNDSQEPPPPRDILYIPQSESNRRYRKRSSCEDR